MQLNFVMQVVYVYGHFYHHATCCTRYGTFAPSGVRGDLAVAVALKLDSRLDGGGYCGARTGEELIAIGRIQRPDLAGFIERNEFRFAESAEFLPHLQIHKRGRTRAIYAGVFTKNLLVHRAHDGSLKHRSRAHHSQKSRRERHANPGTHTRPPATGYSSSVS